MNNNSDLMIDTLVETENYTIWRADEPDQESTFHLELNNVTVHFFREEWDEFVELAKRLLESNY
ncbi:MAG TPA: hypothetical protein VMW34_07490 [Anaerolineales bacterium]|jgi:hypothetical protein|nr:hypothetical protein [Anaerolineales bacterium]